MSVITKPGFYREHGGGQCQIIAVDSYGSAVGFSSENELNVYGCDDGGLGCDPHSNFPYDIDGPWVAELDPGDGWRTLNDSDVVEATDERYFSNLIWETVDKGTVGKSYDSNRHWPMRRRIEPAPFRISDHGCGVYLTRDGQEEDVRVDRPGTYYRWSSGISPGSLSWKDDGRFYRDDLVSQLDLVRYLRPLDPPPSVEWKPTGELRWRKPEAGWYGMTPHLALLGNILEQEWSDGTNTEWRPVTITDGK